MSCENEGEEVRSGEQINASASREVRAGWRLAVCLALIDLEAFVPFLKAFAAVFLQFLVRGEKQFARFLNRFIEFAEIVVIFAAYPGAGLVNAADTVWQQVTTVCLDVQEPAIGIFEYIDTLVGNLPEQVIEIFLGLRRRDLLVDRVTAD